MKRFGILLLAISIAFPVFAGFAATEVYLPAVGRVAGQGGAQFYTTVWTTNLTGAPVSFTFEFLKEGQANPSPASFTDTLAAGQTKMYENVVETRLGLSDALGAARVTSTGEILLAERIYDQAPGDDLGNTQGLFFAGVPKSFSISLGQSASIQGVNQGGSENFRYNFALVETGGGSPTVNVQLFDGDGTLLGQKAYAMGPHEQLQPSVKDLVSTVSTINARITATVTGGTGSVLLAGAQVANESQDSSGFEMSFRDQLLGSGGATAGVASLNGLTGAVTLIQGNNVTLTTVGNGIKIDASGGNGSSGVSSLDGLTGALTLAPGNGISITPSGSSIVIAYTGGGSSGLTSVTHDSTLTGAGTGASPLGLAVPLTISTSNNNSIFSITNAGAGAGIVGGSTNSSGVYGSSNGSTAGGITGYNGGSGYGVWGTSASGIGVYGQGTSRSGVRGDGVNGDGVFGQTGDSAHAGVSGHNTGSGSGVFGKSAQGSGVYGESDLNQGSLTATAGVYGLGAGSGVPGVYGYSPGGDGVEGVTGSGSGYGVYARAATGAGTAGYFSGNLTVTGNSNIMGTKHFIEPHPTDPSKEIRFTSLEGPESGTYFRGRGRVVNGLATIDVPEAFRLVTAEDGLTVQLTPIGDFASLVVATLGLDRVVVMGNRDVEFSYLVQGVRKGFENEPAIVQNKDFIPRSASDSRFAVNIPAEVRRRLIESGILNADGSVNEDTAKRLGWDRRPGWNDPESTP